MVLSRHEKSRTKAASKETGDIGSVETNWMDEQLADDREQQELCVNLGDDGLREAAYRGG